MKKRYLVMQGGARKDGEVSGITYEKAFTNKKDAIKLFNEIKHDQGWTDYYCYTTVELWTIGEDGEEEDYLDTIVQHYEEQIHKINRFRISR